MTRLPDSDRARSLLGMRGAFEGVARWPWMASGMGTDEAQSTSTNRSHHSPQRVVEKVGRSITNSETPHRRRPIPARKMALPSMRAKRPPWNRRQHHPRRQLS